MRPGLLELCRSAPILRKFAAPDAIALTFDDGPDPVSTRQVLALLREYNARATFFVLGRQAELYPEVLRDIRASGSEIGNHSYDHPSFSGLSARQSIAELRRGRLAIGAAGAKLFRPPYGHARRPTPLLAALAGYATVGWSVDARDWERRDGDAMAAELTKKVSPGDIVLLHDRLENAEDERAFNRDSMLAALAAFLRAKAGNFHFRTVGEMMAAHAPIYEQAWDQALQLRDLAEIRANIGKLKRNG